MASPAGFENDGPRSSSGIPAGQGEVSGLKSPEPRATSKAIARAACVSKPSWRVAAELAIELAELVTSEPAAMRSLLEYVAVA